MNSQDDGSTREDDQRQPIHVPVPEREPYEPFGERHPRRRAHVLLGLLYVILGITLLLVPGPGPGMAAWTVPSAAVALIALGGLVLAEGVASPLTRTGAILHVASAAASILLIGLTALASFATFRAGTPALGVVLGLVALTAAYRLAEQFKSTREAWAVARKGAPPWWREGQAPGKENP